MSSEGTEPARCACVVDPAGCVVYTNPRCDLHGYPTKMDRHFRLSMNAAWEAMKWRASQTRYGEVYTAPPPCSCWFNLDGTLHRVDPECPTHGKKPA